jgi:AbrB family transcriptional regulator, stage V sporulation protein T
MATFSQKMQMNDNGRVVIPKEIREVIGAKSGDEIIFLVQDDEVTITTRAKLVKRLHGIFARNDGLDLTEELLEDRRREAAAKGW